MCYNNQVARFSGRTCKTLICTATYFLIRDYLGVIVNSVELASLLKKRHKNVLRDLRSLSKKNNYNIKESVYFDLKNRKMPCFELCSDIIKIALVYYNRNDIISQIDCGYKDIKPSFIRNEFSFGEDIIFNMFSEYKIISQYSVLGGKYFIDWYIPELKLAIEYDECHHVYNKNDKARQDEIERELGCRFIRYKE